MSGREHSAPGPDGGAGLRRDVTIRAFGEGALVVELPGSISELTFLSVRAIDSAIRAAAIPAVIDVVPAYCSVLVVFDPLAVDPRAMEDLVARLVPDTPGHVGGEEDRLVIPVLYGEEAGPDLGDVARHAGLSPEEVIGLHSAPWYLVHMIGFTPGFPYLGGMPERLAMPRRKNPRVRIPAGSVGIADGQTGIYPRASPGGWNLIGRTPLRLFDPLRNPPALLHAGCRVRFEPIDRARFLLLAEASGAFAQERETDDPGSVR